jgi:uncharacterized protein YndB with AHSA1/START domain
MLIVRRSRTIAASRGELWDVLGDPHHLPRWWPRVNRVEAVTLTDGDVARAGTASGGEQDAFTEVLMGSSGKIVRADFKLLATEVSDRIVWAQQVSGTPFERVLKSAETEIWLADAPVRAGIGPKSRSTQVTDSDGESTQVADSDGESTQVTDPDRGSTQVTIELRQELQGFRGQGVLSLRMAGISRFGSPLVRRAAAATIEEALDGLDRIVGRAS